ncbi:MAG: heme-binding protein [Pirellulaceae bacterium]|nr:heme-binding protein [Pirellulaceae bacterium]
MKHYPAYRKAETSGKVAFWTLFQHITTAGISMTAPVEMTFQADGPPVGREQSMAFLYGDKSIGSAGRKGNVDVVDVPAATVVCIGVRGVRSDEVLVQAERNLRNWLDENKSRYQQSGPVRVMGYNSPFVARDRQFFEVQIPVRELPVASAA